ncbi:MAG: A/G-specific adenine glycosylase [Kiritimatiellae bacterium]|nr:A/G-specific adenine glycosylase [Kiritimatiellia bacterium]
MVGRQKGRSAATKPGRRSRWRERLLSWFQRNRRAMPWRDDPSPYRVWISEIMLQQTQVDTVIPYFRRFLARFPSIRTLAAADTQQVLKAWEGLGYYARARNLHAAARQVVARFDGKLPDAPEELAALPGVGAYTAAAVASIAYGRPVPAVDGNVLRVFARFWGLSEDIRAAKTRQILSRRLAPYVPVRRASAFNQAAMELGALVCRPKQPGCRQCPLRTDCTAFRTGRTAKLPVRSPRRPVPNHEIAVGVVWRRGRVLIARRKQDRMLGGLWEFPGGKRRAGERLAQTAAREVREETRLKVRVGPPYCTVRHAYSHFTITLTAFRCRCLSGRATPVTSDEVKWVSLTRAREHPMPAANKKVLAAVERSERSTKRTGRCTP